MKVIIVAAAIAFVVMMAVKTERKERHRPEIFCSDPSQGPEPHFCEWKLRYARNNS